MEWLYAVRLERGHQRGTIKADLCLTNRLVFNFEYFNGDSHVTNSIEPADDSCGNFMVALRSGDLH
jgi:hypothetical protein